MQITVLLKALGQTVAVEEMMKQLIHTAELMKL
jgi:hypothetical protein